MMDETQKPSLVFKTFLITFTLLTLFFSANYLQAEETPSESPQYDLQEVKTEMTKITGRLEELEYEQKSQNYSELKENVAKLETRLSEVEKNQTAILTDIKTIKDKMEVEAKAAAAIPNKDLLTQGFGLLADQRYNEAMEKFQAVLDHGAKGKEAATASYGLGESQFGLKDYKKAIVEYSKVRDEFPKSSRMPASLYHIGLSFELLNMNKEAKDFFQELIEHYPKSPEAKKARHKMK